jgi:hypothetical protein
MSVLDQARMSKKGYRQITGTIAEKMTQSDFDSIPYPAQRGFIQRHRRLVGLDLFTVKGVAVQVKTFKEKLQESLKLAEGVEPTKDKPITAKSLRKAPKASGVKSKSKPKKPKAAKHEVEGTAPVVEG